MACLMSGGFSENNRSMGETKVMALCMKRKDIGGRQAGFTLIEILFAIAILAIGGTSLVALFGRNLALAKMAREEVVINVIQRDVSVRNQIAAYTRGVTPFVDNSWLVADIDDYNLMAESADREWGQIPAYKGYYFWIAELQRTGSAWGLPDSTSATYGLELMDAQFVDWDGYGKLWLDLNGNGQEDAGERVDFGDPAPSHRVHYDSRGMSHYFKRLQGVIAWDLKEDISGMAVADIVDGLQDGTLGKYHMFYFTVYNPDAQKF